jgi:hypothetical protein
MSLLIAHYSFGKVLSIGIGFDLIDSERYSVVPFHIPQWNDEPYKSERFRLTEAEPRAWPALAACASAGP